MNTFFLSGGREMSSRGGDPNFSMQKLETTEENV